MESLRGAQHHRDSFVVCCVVHKPSHSLGVLLQPRIYLESYTSVIQSCTVSSLWALNYLSNLSLVFPLDHT